MTETGGDQKKTKGKVKAHPQRWIWSSPQALGGAAIGGLTVLTGIYAAANHDLTGWHFVVAILFGGAAVMLLVEAFNRTQSHAAATNVVALGLIAAIASVTFVLLPAGHPTTGVYDPFMAQAPTSSASEPPEVSHGATPASGRLHLTVRMLPREIFGIAFSKPISLPASNEGATALLRRGGVEVDQANFRVMLADQTSEPIAVTSLRLEVLESKPTPEGAYAYQFTQGGEGIEKFVATIAQPQKGSIAHLYEANPSGGEEGVPPFFATNYIHLHPEEASPENLTVRVEPRRLVRFRLVAEGSSARRHFIQRSPAFSLAGGRQGNPDAESWERVYVHGQFPGICTATPQSQWYDTRFAYSDAGAPCPEGKRAPEAVDLPEASSYPVGHFRLDLGLSPDAQSAMIDGVVVGAGPAAKPTQAVVMKLLRALGAWSTCVKRWPEPGYWTAEWEPWGLFLVFLGEAGDECNPKSGAPVAQIEVDGRGQVIHTNLGAVKVGGDPAMLSSAIKAAATSDQQYDGSVLIVPGVTICNPEHATERPQIPPQQIGGMLVVNSLKPGSNSSTAGTSVGSKINKVITTLPEERC